EIIVRSPFERCCTGFSNVDTNWNCRPSPAFAQFRQPFRDDVRAVIIETESIDQCVLLRQSKDAGLGIPRLRFRSDGPDFDEPEPERCPGGKCNTVFVQPGSKSDRIWKVQAEERSWL